MAVARLTGQGASSRKYDILTAIGAAGLADKGGLQRLALRLIVLVTARYDWRADRLLTGQREIAALWSVDERTVKREMALLRNMGWLVLRRPAARGRVAEYGLGLERILADTAPHWPAVGSDLQDRLSVDPPTAQPPNVIAFRAPDGQDPWDRVLRKMAEDAPVLYSTWLRQLRLREHTPDSLRLEAPSRFHALYVNTHLSLRLLAACEAVAPEIRALRVEVAG